jgi:hypothetical protein
LFTKNIAWEVCKEPNYINFGNASDVAGFFFNRIGLSLKKRRWRLCRKVEHGELYTSAPTTQKP